MSAISSIGFTAGGIDVNTIVTGLMAAERAPESLISARKADVSLQSAALGRLRASLLNLQSQAAAMVSAGVSKLSSNVSSTAASATISATAGPGSLSFTIDALATANGVRTSNAVGSSTAVVTTAASLAISTTANKLGVSTINVGTGTATGPYTITVTQATAGAAANGTSPLAASTVIDATNNTLNVKIDGVARTLTLAAGTYTPSGLAGAVQTALDASGGGAKASLSGDGRINLTTTHEGSTASLEIVGGSAAGDLRLGAGSSTGTDGAVKIGTNPSVAVTSAGTGTTVAVSTGTGTLNVTLAGGLRVGDAAAAVVSTGDRSLAAVAAAINGANIGASAAAVKVADGSWLLQMNSSRTGVSNSLSLDASVFSGAGGLVETAAATDAKITIGSGAGAYSVLSTTNAFTDVLPGVTVTASAVSATPVTVSVGRDDGATADAVGSLVAAATSLLADIKMQTAYNTKTNKGSPLSGDPAARRMAAQIRSAVTSMVGGGSMSLAGNAGITIKQDGTLNFDRTIFLAALEKDPAAVERLFGRGGTGAGGASWAASTDNTVAGPYGVVVTTAPRRATSGDILAGGSVAGQTIGVRIGTTIANFTAAAGATAADIVAGLNAALAKAGMKVNAEVIGVGLSAAVRLTAVGFGGTGSFDSNLDTTNPAGWSTNPGTDVAGTIDGKSAIGIGNRLSLLDGDASSPASGLGVDIAEGVSGTIGPVTYQPGIAARLVSLAGALTGTNGALTTSASTYDAKVTAFNAQISAFEVRMTAKEAQYRRQWTAVQSSLASLQNQGTWLASQVTGLPNVNAK